MSLKEIVQDKAKLDYLCKAAFDVVDTDKSGFLDKIELEAVMFSVGSEMGLPKSKDHVESILKELDKNDLGKVGLSDFRVMVEVILREIIDEEDPSNASKTKPSTDTTGMVLPATVQPQPSTSKGDQHSDQSHMDSKLASEEGPKG